MDHILRSGEQGWVKVEYVVNSPVRAGLCSKPPDYPWSWANPDLLELRDLPESAKKVIERQQERLTAEGGCATQWKVKG